MLYRNHSALLAPMKPDICRAARDRQEPQPVKSTDQYLLLETESEGTGSDYKKELKVEKPSVRGTLAADFQGV